MKHLASRGFLTLVIFVICFILFGLDGPWSSLGLASLQVASLVSGQSQGGDISSGLSYAEGLLPIVIAVVINLIVYYILAELILFIGGLMFGREKS